MTSPHNPLMDVCVLYRRDPSDPSNNRLLFSAKHFSLSVVLNAGITKNSFETAETRRSQSLCKQMKANKGT
jgi:hypothetical protein